MTKTRYLSTFLLVVTVSPIVGHVIFTLVPGAGSYVVATGSMAPSITAGSLIYVIDTGEYNVDDVVTFQREGEVVTHRIVAVESDHYVTKGDANDGRDAPVSHDQVIGKVVFSVPLYGYFFAIASTPIGYGLLIVIPSVLLIWIELRQDS